MFSWSVFWIIIAAISFIVELASVGLVSLWFVAGALVALLVAELNGAIWLQWILFIVVSCVGLLVFRSIWLKKMKPRLSPTNLEMLIGMEVFVTETIDSKTGTGEVKINGQLWTAKALNVDKIEKGEKVSIINREGNTVIVELIK